MKDLDFDELDKAVSSLMAGVPKTPDPSSEAEKTVTIPSSGQTPPAPASPSSLVSVSQAALVMQPTKPFTPKPLSTPRSSVVPASRRAGRFMDVVRPAAASNKQGTPAKVSRQGAALEPVSSNVTPLPRVVELPASSAAIATSEKTADAPRSDWPDPLDMVEFSEAKPSESEVKDEKSDLVEQSPMESPDTPLNSPFLPDTKVEKRPLGANAVANAGVTEPYEDPKLIEQSREDEYDEQLPATLEDTKSILPDELHRDLVAIESDTTSPDAEETDKSKEAKVWKMQEEPKAESPTAEPSKPSIPISIPQQYKEEVSTGEKESGAIYDTDSYHKPLAHPTKQKSGWMWVIWIVLILIIGAGGGAALYFLRLV